VEKYYPSGFLRPEYVESLFDELIITDQERLIEKFADRFGYTKNEFLNDEIPDVNTFVDNYQTNDILDALNNDDIENYIFSKLTDNEILAHVNIDNAVDYYEEDELLNCINDDKIYRYFFDNDLDLPPEGEERI
jgi:hypothetical protein